MTKTFAMAVSLAFIVTVAVSPVWAVGDKVRSDKAAGTAGDESGGDPQVSRGTPVGESVQDLSIQEDVKGEKSQSGTTVSLTEAEKKALLFMREEEKLARDIYVILANSWGLPVFSNIAESEQQHMDAVLYLLGKYGLEDPAPGPGEFTDGDLQNLYDSLIGQEITSVEEALYIGIIIEQTDIEDIKAYLEDIDKKDIIQVFTNLLEGSKSHLEAFESHL
jgi:hypothetical protein